VRVAFVIVSDLRDLERAAEVLPSPFDDPRIVADAAEAMRFGSRSVDEQLDAGVEMSGNSSFPWERTKPFGSRHAPRRTLQRDGVLREAWLGGGAGADEGGDGSSVFVGVDTGAVPYAGVFQRDSPVHWRAKSRGAGGRLKAQTYLGLEYGVWISEERLLEGWDIPPRRLGVSDDMAERVGDVILRHALGVAGAAGERGATA
jgi:hypothetical protein